MNWLALMQWRKEQRGMISFTVIGVPIPQGSIAVFTPKPVNGVPRRPIVTTDNAKLKKWRKEVERCARLAIVGGSPAGRKVALKVTAHFSFLQAKSNKDKEHTIKPDLDKLARALLDGMSKIIYEDDSQVVELVVTKQYGAHPGVIVNVKEVTAEPRLVSLTTIEEDRLPF